MFDRLENAAKAVLEIVPLGPSACDLMDRRHLSLARERLVHYDLLIPPQTEAAATGGVRRRDVLPKYAMRCTHAIDRVRRKKRLAFHAVQAQDPAEMELHWQLGAKVVPTLFRMKGSTRPVPFVEDLAVPPAALCPTFWCGCKTCSSSTKSSPRCSRTPDTGRLHIRPFLDLARSGRHGQDRPVGGRPVSEVLAVGGTISGEHADGLSRTAFIRQQYGPLADVFAEVKRIFDPANTFNPGKVVHGDPHALTSNLRRWPLPPDARRRPTQRPVKRTATDTRSPIALQLRWTEAEIAANRARLQRLRRLPHAIEIRADVPHLSPGAGGREFAAGQGQPDACHPDRPARSRDAGQG